MHGAWCSLVRSLFGTFSMARYSLKLHGVWVRLKGTDREGRIAYYDHKTEMVWVVWDDGGASGCTVPELLRLRQWEPAPWYKRKVVKRLQRT